MHQMCGQLFSRTCLAHDEDPLAMAFAYVSRVNIIGSVIIEPQITE
jgi:hypothetical protein